MAGLTLYGRSQALKALLARDLFDSVSGWWIALSLVVPSPGDAGIHLVEPDDPAYARQSYGFDSSYWGESGLGNFGNLQSVTFPPPSTDWGIVNGWAIVDSASGDGHLWIAGEIVSPQRVVSGPDAAVVVDVGALQVRFIA